MRTERKSLWLGNAAGSDLLADATAAYARLEEVEARLEALVQVVESLRVRVR